MLIKMIVSAVLRRTDMSTYLEAAKLCGQSSTMPGIPNRDIGGQLYGERNALVFKGHNGNFSLIVAWEQIKQCSVFSRTTVSMGAALSALMTFGIIDQRDWFV